MRNATGKTIHADITTDPIKQMMSANHVYLFGEKQNTSIVECLLCQKLW